MGKCPCERIEYGVVACDLDGGKGRTVYIAGQFVRGGANACDRVDFFHDAYPPLESSWSGLSDLVKKLKIGGANVVCPDVEKTFGPKLVDVEEGGVDPVDAYRCQTKKGVNIGLFRGLRLSEVYQAMDVDIDMGGENINDSFY